jgi:hypothetical protein
VKWFGSLLVLLFDKNRTRGRAGEGVVWKLAVRDEFACGWTEKWFVMRLHEREGRMVERLSRE